MDKNTSRAADCTRACHSNQIHSFSSKIITTGELLTLYSYRGQYQESVFFFIQQDKAHPEELNFSLLIHTDEGDARTLCMNERFKTQMSTAAAWWKANLPTKCDG